MNSNTTDLVTVVIPSYNRETLIAKTLDSVLEQTHQNWECFVVDDLSTDKTCEVVKSYEEKDKRIHLIEMPNKGNANVSRNKGIASGTGKYVAMLDSDDLWRENHLQSRIECIKTTKTDGVYGGSFFSSPKNSYEQQSRIQKTDESNFYFATFSMVPKQTSGLLFSRKAIEDVKWDNELFRHQDFDLIFRFLNKYTLGLDKNITVIMNIDENRNSIINSTGKTHNLYLDGCIQYYEKHKNEFYANPFQASLYLFTFIKLLFKQKNWPYAKYYTIQQLKVLANIKRLKEVVIGTKKYLSNKK